MRKQLFSLILLSATLVGKAQNLVPNGDFETYSTCPTAEAQIDFATPWTNPVIWSGGGYQADYFNQCNTGTFVGIPTNTWGYQQTHSGNGYSGIFLYSAFWADLREYIQAPLTSPLNAGTCYHFEMYVNLANRSQFTTDGIAVYLSNTTITGITNYYPLPFIPQISAPGIFPDSLSWTLISANYTAAGGESYLIIGNFNDDISTIFVNANSTGIDESYVYIDDVSLSPCTGIEEHNQQSQITIYPNPANDLLFINDYLLLKKENEIKIYDMEGRKALQSIISERSPSDNQHSKIINIQSLQPGIYFIEINGVRKKFVKQ